MYIYNNNSNNNNNIPPKNGKTNHVKSSLKYIKMVVNYFDIFCMLP